MNGASRALAVTGVAAALFVGGVTSGNATPSRTTASASGSSVPVQNAINSAKQYLQTEAFSKQGLIDQLDSPYGDQYPVSVATSAVNSLNVNWNAEAVLAAKQYLHTESFSCQGLIQQLSSSFGEKFTLAQAQYAAQNVGLCGSGGTTHPSTSSSGSSVIEQNAIKSAKQYLQTQAFSKQGLIDQLASAYGDKYPVNVATSAVNSLNVNWNAEAVLAAKQYLHTESFSCQGLIQQLSSSFGEKFTLAQAQYAAHKVGLC